MMAEEELPQYGEVLKWLEASSKTLNKAREHQALWKEFEHIPKPIRLAARLTACFDVFVRDFETILNGDELREDKILGDVDEDILNE